MTVLKVLMVILGIVRIVFGAFVLLAPGQFLDTMGLGTLSDTARFFMGAAGIAWISAGAWAMYSVRDLARNIIFVKFAITLELLNAAGLIYFGAVGYTPWADMVVPITIACAFSVLLLVFYPWRAAQKKAAG